MHQPIFLPDYCFNVVHGHTASVKPEGSPVVAEKISKKQKSKRFTRPSICLDYLKGQCTGRRFQCKYLHPDLTEFHQKFGGIEPGTESQVCEVWVLTGHCKFGAKCNKLHPPREDAAGEGKKGCQAKKLKDTDLEVMSAELGAADAEADFEDFVKCVAREVQACGVDAGWFEDKFCRGGPPERVEQQPETPVAPLIGKQMGGGSGDWLPGSHSPCGALEGGMAPFHCPGSGTGFPDACGSDHMNAPGAEPVHSVSSVESVDAAAESTLHALLSKPAGAAAFDQILLDILSDLHLVSA